MAKGKNSKDKKQNKKSGRISAVIFGLIFLIGFGILAYPTISDQWNTWRQQQLITDYTSTISEMTPEDFSAEWEAAKAYNATVSTDIFSDAFNEDEEDMTSSDYWKVLNVAGDGVMGYISIPKINIQLAIYHGTGESVLQTGVGHLSSSNLPIGETGSHTVLAAHRGLPSARLFTDIDQLEIGDMFYLHILDETLAYQVDQISPMIDKDDHDALSEALSAEEGKDYVTLFTCTPYGVNSHRLLVRGVRVPYTEEVETTTAVDTMVRAIQNYYMLYLILGLAVTILVILILRFIFRPRRRADEKDSREDEN